jgi:hypothetical protein
MLQAQTQIERLQGELEEARLTERRMKQELAEERRHGQELLSVSERRKKKQPSQERLAHHPRREAKSAAQESSDVVSSSSAASGSSSKRLAGTKDPFNVSSPPVFPLLLLVSHPRLILTIVFGLLSLFSFLK